MHDSEANTLDLFCVNGRCSASFVPGTHGYAVAPARLAAFQKGEHAFLFEDDGLTPAESVLAREQMTEKARRLAEALAAVSAGPATVGNANDALIVESAVDENDDEEREWSAWLEKLHSFKTYFIAFL